jgi:hypothetical protein
LQDNPDLTPLPSHNPIYSPPLRFASGPAVPPLSRDPIPRPPGTWGAGPVGKVLGVLGRGLREIFDLPSRRSPSDPTANDAARGEGSSGLRRSGEEGRERGKRELAGVRD